ERGLVHRDIKPANLLLLGARDKGRGASEDRATAPMVPGPSPLAPLVKILDMGLARLETSAPESSDPLTMEGAVLGTLDYLAPEQAQDARAADIRSDLYSLGCTFFYLLTGRVPFPGVTATEKLLRHRLDDVPWVQHPRPDVPPAVAAVVHKLMA